MRRLFTQSFRRFSVRLHAWQELREHTLLGTVGLPPTTMLRPARYRPVWYQPVLSDREAHILDSLQVGRGLGFEMRLTVCRTLSCSLRIQRVLITTAPGKRLGPPNSHASGGNFGVTNGVVKGAAWADARNAIPMHGFTQDGVSSPGPCPINCTNNNEMYSFHSGGVHCVLADGAVRFLSQSIDIDTMTSLITAKAHEVIPLGRLRAVNPISHGLDQMARLSSAGANLILSPA